MAPSLPARASWRPDIQGLRGLAVLLVVCFHAGLPAFRGAFVAVDVFFVLSGFFLTTALTRQIVERDHVAVADVYARRVWRLLPDMVVVLLATLFLTMVFYAPIDRAAVAQHVIPVAFFSGNLAFAAGGVNYFSAGENPLLHTWTLGVEYQLVLLLTAFVAWLAWLGRRRAHRDALRAGYSEALAPDRRLIVMRTVLTGIAVVCAISFATSVLVNDAAPMWAYFGPHTRLWSFAAGAAAAFIAGAGQSVFGASISNITLAQSLGLAAIFAPALMFDRSMSYPGAIALAPVGGTLLLLSGGALASSTAVGRWLSSPALTWLGRVSYPWYLWHWPLMVLGGVLTPGLGAWGKLAWGVLGLGFAVLTQRLVERPASRWLSPRLSTRYPLLYALGVCVAVMTLAQLVVARSNRAVATSVHRTFAAARGDRMEHGCWVRSLNTATRGSCAFGAPASPTKLALLGDSHAEHWLGGLERAGRANNWRVDVHVMGGCPVSDFSQLVNGATARRFRDCSRYREAMITQIIAERPRAVILSNFDDYLKLDGSGTHEHQVSEAAWTEGLRRTYTRFHAAGIPMVVLRGTPRVPFDVPSCQSRRAAALMFAGDCRFTPNRSFMLRAQSAQNTAARGLNVQFVDMNDVICAGTRCETMRNGLVMFTDDNHLTASFARSLGGVLGTRVASALR